MVEGFQLKNFCKRRKWRHKLFSNIEIIAKGKSEEVITTMCSIANYLSRRVSIHV